MRALAAGLALVLGASCAGAPPDLQAWPRATATIGGRLRAACAEGDALAREAGTAQHDPAWSAWARSCSQAWSAMERYATRALAGVEQDPWSRAGVEAQVAALAELHRDLLACGALPADPLDAETAARVAREMRAASSTAAAFARAAAATRPLAEQVALAHARLAEAFASLGAELAARRAAADADRRAQLSHAEQDLAALEDELRMEAAGAGRARPEAAAAAAGARTRVAALRVALAEADARAAAIARSCAGLADRARRSGFAAREWAISHREAGRALLDGLPAANFSLLAASAAEAAQ